MDGPAAEVTHPARCGKKTTLRSFGIRGTGNGRAGLSSLRSSPRLRFPSLLLSCATLPSLRSGQAGQAGLAELVNPCGVDPFCWGLVPQVATCGYSRAAPVGQQSTGNESPQRRARCPRPQGCARVRGYRTEHRLLTKRSHRSLAVAALIPCGSELGSAAKTVGWGAKRPTIPRQSLFSDTPGGARGLADLDSAR